MWIVWSLLAGFLISLAYISPYALRMFQERRLRARCRRERVLVLTYDDGPGIVLTPKLLDLLAAYNAKATFFLVGKCVMKAPESVARLQRDGHELASHSYAHLNAWKTTPWQGVNDVQRGFTTLGRNGIPFKLFRPPYGKITLLTWLATVCRGIGFGWWTKVSGDTYANLPDPQSVVQAIEQDGGGVVLLHDFDGTEERSTFVLELTKRLLDAAKSRGWKVCTQSELLRIQ